MTNFKEMLTILNCHKFQIDSQVSIYVNCVICKKLLIDAYRGPCWCNYCKHCAENYFGINEKYCPGDNIDCKLRPISVESDIAKDNSADHRVSRLDVKCPWNSCAYKGRLMEMHDHLRTCNKKPIKCPFSEIGCTAILQENESITDHLITKLGQHCNLIMEWIRIMRNNILNDAIRRERENTENCFIILFNEKMRAAIDNWRNTGIGDLQREIRNKSLKNADLKQQIKNIQEISDRKILIMKEFLDRQRILLIRLRNERQNKKYKIISNKLNKIEGGQDQIGNLNNSIHSYNKNSISPLEAINGAISKTGSTTDTIGSFAWNISDLSRKKKFRVNLKSVFFESSDNQYVMWMILYPGGYEDHTNTHISIAFYIKSRRSKDASLIFPLTCNLSMTIFNEIQSSSQLTISKKCYFSGKGVNNENFHFPVDELDRASVTSCDTIIISCKLRHFQ